MPSADVAIEYQRRLRAHSRHHLRLGRVYLRSAEMVNATNQHDVVYTADEAVIFLATC